MSPRPWNFFSATAPRLSSARPLVSTAADSENLRRAQSISFTRREDSLHVLFLTSSRDNGRQSSRPPGPDPLGNWSGRSGVQKLVTIHSRHVYIRQNRPRSTRAHELQR